MKNKLVVIAGLLIVLNASAAGAGRPSYYRSDADKVTFFNKITDYVATVGKSSTEKKKILKQRRYSREQARIRKQRGR